MAYGKLADFTGLKHHQPNFSTRNDVWGIKDTD
jgi:hypothetical protein